jgi:hypothetical protein
MRDCDDIDLAPGEFRSVIRDQSQVPSAGRAPVAPLEEQELVLAGHGLTQDQSPVTVFDDGCPDCRAGQE